MTKAELLASIQTERERLDTSIASLGDNQQTAPVLEAGWSVKDVLAHVSAWELYCSAWLEAVARDVTPERPEVRDVDATNARAYEAAHDAPLADVLAASRASYEALRAAVEQLPNAELDDEQRFGWPMWRMIDGNSAEHYREHAQQIEAAFGTKEPA